MKVITVTKESFEKEVKEAKQPVLVDFNADWCGPCRMLAPILEEIAKENDKVKFASVNIDDEDELATEYHVFSIPCLVMFKDGKEEKRSVGLLSRDELNEFIGE